MIYNKVGETLELEGKRYVVGYRVFAIAEDEYEKLLGTIVEIRTDVDAGKKSPVEIVCNFEKSPFPHENKFFSALELNGVSREPDDIRIISPEDDWYEGGFLRLSLFCNIKGSERECDVYFEDIDKAELLMRQIITDDKKTNDFKKWMCNPKFEEDSEEFEFYSASLENGEYTVNIYPEEIAFSWDIMAHLSRKYFEKLAEQEFLRALKDSEVASEFDSKYLNEMFRKLGIGSKMLQKIKDDTVVRMRFTSIMQEIVQECNISKNSNKNQTEERK